MSAEMDALARVQRAETLYQTGNDAAKRANFDYAIQMYKDACRFAPEKMSYRQALRAAQRLKFGNDPSKVGRLVGVQVQPIRLQVKTMKARGQWAHVLETCEEAFAHNPWDVGTARDAAEAATALDLKNLAEWLLESVHAQGENDVAFLRQEAAAHEDNEHWNKATHCWERIKKVSPYDEEANRRANEIAAKATIQRSGLGNAINKRIENEKEDAEPTASRVEALRVEALPPEERYLKEIEGSPDRVGAYLSLADHYKRENRLEDAEKILLRGRDANPEDNVIRTAYADMRIARFKSVVESWIKHLQRNPDDLEAKAKLAQLQESLSTYEVKELRRRIALKPEDLTLRLSVGQALARLGRHDEAIAEFQQSRNNPALKVQSLYCAALSFEANGVLKLAERHYHDAIKALDPDDVSMLNSLHYRLGRIAEAQGNLASAEEHYNEVAANDYTYLDVAQRIRELNKKPVVDD